MSSRVVGVLGAVFVLIATAACAGTGAGDGSGRPTVVVTTNVLGDIAQNALGGVADVEWVMPRGASPHQFDISAAQVQRMYEADLVIANGLGLEQVIGSVLEIAKRDGVPVYEVAPALPTRTYGEASPEEAASVDPHIWTDPRRMVPVAEMMAEWLITEVPEIDADAVRADAAAYRAELEAADAAAAATFDERLGPHRVIVTSHHSFGYFADRYDFEVLGVILPSGAQLASPSAADLAELSVAIERAGIPAIFVDSSKPQDLAEALAAESDVDVQVVEVHAESLTPEGAGAGSYLEMVESNAGRIADALAG